MFLKICVLSCNNPLNISSPIKAVNSYKLNMCEKITKRGEQVFQRVDKTRQMIGPKSATSNVQSMSLTYRRLVFIFPPKAEGCELKTREGHYSTA